MNRSSSQSEHSTTPLVPESDPSLASSSSPTLKSKRSVSFKLPTLKAVIEKPARSSPTPAETPPSSPEVVASPDEVPDEVDDALEHDTEHRNDDLQPGPRQRRRAFTPMLVLENSGSVARDHLASERTFLAYVRTSLAIASTGVALVQLFTVSSNAKTADSASASAIGKQIQTYAKPLGSASVCLGIAVLIIGVTRYFTVQHALTEGKFPVARLLVGAIAFILLVITTFVFAVLISGRR